MSALRKAILVMILLLILAGCRQEDPAISEPLPTLTRSPLATPTATALPPARPTATTAPTTAPLPTRAVAPTPISPSISVDDQPLADNGTLTFTAVSVADPAWLVVYALQGGQTGDLLAYTAVAPGINEDIELQIDPLQATLTMEAVLHQDAGEMGKFEFPGPDTPLEGEAAASTARFAITPLFLMPSITVADQELGEDGLLFVDQVDSPGPGWLLVHADESGKPGMVLGTAHLEKGGNENVVVPIRWRQSTSRLYAALYHDAGEQFQFEESEDGPVLAAGQPVVASFEVTLPVDVYALDQPVVNGEIVIERAATAEPAWLVIYADDGGDIGRIIGFAPLVEGVNELLVVKVVERAVTPDLHILLHEDTAPGDEFDFPSADGPIRVDGRLPEPFTFRTDSGSYLITRDQEPGATEVPGKVTLTIPLIVVDSPAWAVLSVDADGEVGEAIGQTRVPAGVHHEVMLATNAEQLTEKLYVTLHLDAGTPEIFDYPDGPDLPLRYSGREIRSPFVILQPPTD